jgi:hypothetical protein
VQQSPSVNAKKLRIAAEAKATRTGVGPVIAKRGSKSNFSEGTQAPHNPYAVSRELMFEILRKTNVLTRTGQLTKAFK